MFHFSELAVSLHLFFLPLHRRDSISYHVRKGLHLIILIDVITCVSTHLRVYNTMNPASAQQSCYRIPPSRRYIICLDPSRVRLWHLTPINSACSLPSTGCPPLLSDWTVFVEATPRFLIAAYCSIRNALHTTHGNTVFVQTSSLRHSKPFI